jgi:hypothetical protein
MSLIKRPAGKKDLLELQKRTRWYDGFYDTKVKTP